jgi:two-component system CheB/CheR fusion protein
VAQINSKKERRTKKSEPTVAHSFEKFPIVGIGASAGGLEAILQLFAALPSNTDLAFVIVQHLDPHRETQMAEILSRITSMTVHLIKDGEQVKPNHVYVIPPGHHLVFSNGTLNLLPPQDQPYK